MIKNRASKLNKERKLNYTLGCFFWLTILLPQYFWLMINATELRLGNYLLYKTGVRILPVRITFEHFELLSKGGQKDAFPIPLKPDILKKCGFLENKKYYLLPEAREFALTLPVMGNNKNEMYAYVNSNGDTYARASVNDLVITNNFHYVHQLQNLYFAFTGKEIEVAL